ncbi:MAG: prolipoprotein diacylglyceryl transferase [Armatimonadetes bacterium]|nr:prolipoprotein diacylglyceryl transferase [Armatimonadota bacterium]
MHPELFRLGSFPVRSYGVLLVIGVVIAVSIARKRAPHYGIDKDKIWDSAFWLVLPGILGARITYIVQNWPYYQSHPAELWSLRFEGLTSFGGILFGFFGFLVWRLRAKVPFWPFLDTVGVPVLVAQAVGRIGCLFNGCCYGRPTTEWYGVIVQGLPDKHVPAQLVDTALMLVGAAAIALWDKAKPRKPGVSFGLFVVAYGLSRFVYEFFRAGTKEEMAAQIASSTYVKGLPVTLAQVVCLLLVAIGVAIAAANSRRNPQGPVPSVEATA